MKYAVHIQHRLSTAERLVRVLDGRHFAASVYVIGVPDDVALASIMIDGHIDPMKVFGKHQWIEAIGTTDHATNLATLEELAQKRIAELTERDRAYGEG